MAFAPRRPLFDVPSRSIEQSVEAGLVGGVSAEQPPRRSRPRRSRPPSSRPCRRTPRPPSRSSTASWTPVDAPDGTAARPSAPDSSRTSTSTVGLPRESKIWRAWTVGDGAHGRSWPMAGKVPGEPGGSRVHRHLEKVGSWGNCSPWRGRSTGPGRRAAAGPSSAAVRQRAARPPRRGRRSGRVAWRSSSSGSASRRRATLTQAKRRSPSSAARRSWVPSSSSAFSSASSSSRSASAPSTSGYSNPTAAARRCTFRACRSAGSASGTSWNTPSRPSCSRLICSHCRRTAPAVEASRSPKTCGCRLTSFA